jgi:hypothetical protein
MPRQKKYNTPHRRHVIKTRLDDDEYDFFQIQCKTYNISQAEMIRQSLTKLKIRPVVHVSVVDDKMLSAIGTLTAAYGKIGGNLNQIARYLNEYGAPYNALSKEVRDAADDLAALKFEVLKKVGEAVGYSETHQL